MMKARRAPGLGAWTRAALLAAVTVFFGCADAPLPLSPPPLARGEALEGGWATIGRMVSGRTGQTATLLPSGKVLIAGGNDVTGAELYDPATGTFVPTKTSMNIGRMGHTATMLRSGMVLLAGGDVPSISAAPGRAPVKVTEIKASTAEIYDPMSDTFFPIGPMRMLRRHHTATVLSDGAVLIIGGDNAQGTPGSYGTTTATAELFSGEIPLPCDPHAPLTPRCPTVSTPTGSMNVTRARHTATTLLDGSVLVVGGVIDPLATEATTTAERYDPLTRTFSLTQAGARAPLAEHTATLLPGSGRVLIAGSRSSKLTAATLREDVEIYDPGTDSFDLVVTNKQDPRFSVAIPANATATLLPSDEVLIVGSPTTVHTKTALIFHEATHTLQVAHRTACAYTQAHTATLLPSGQVLLSGGRADDSAQSCAELFDPSIGALRDPVSQMTSVRLDHAATLLRSGKVLITGGRSSRTNIGSAIDEAEIFDPESLAFEKLPVMLIARSNHTATRLPSGDVLIVGGLGPEIKPADKATHLFEIYRADCDPSRSKKICFDEISFQSDLTPIARVGHTATLLTTGKVLLAGGTEDASAAQLFDPRQSTLSALPTVHRSYHTATRLLDGRVLLAGGNGLVSAEIYDPRTNFHLGSFSPAGSMRSAHAVAAQSFAATLLPSGKVLVAGLDSAELFDPDAAGGIGAFGPAGPMSPCASKASGTLLPSGKVLIVCGSVFQVYDPATNKFTDHQGLTWVRDQHTATLLPTGQVLIAGGGDTALAQLWGFAEAPGATARKPVLASTPDRVLTGATSPWKITGKGFSTSVEGSSGAASSSPTNYPFVRVLLDDGGALSGNITAWTATNATLSLPVSRIGGDGLVFVMTNGIASQGRPITIQPMTACSSNLDCDARESCQFDGTCKLAEGPATPPLGCAIEGAGRRGEAPTGAVAATTLLAACALRKLRARRRARARS